MAELRRLKEAVLEDTSTSGTKFAALDGLRGIAVLVVFFSHSSGFDQRLLPQMDFHGTGHLGVYLFFVLSGFLLSHALLQRPEIDHHILGAFWLRRFFRIAPLYYLVLGVVMLCQLATGKVYTATYGIRNLYIADHWVGFLKHLVFLKGNSVFWTIAAEFEFYFLLPFLVLILIRFGRRGFWFLALFAIAYFAWGLAIARGLISPRYALKIADITHVSQFLDVFLCGTLAAWLYQQAAIREWWGAHRGVLDATAVAVGLSTLVASLAFVADRFFFFHGNWTKLRDLSLLYGASFSFLLLAALLGGRFPGALFRPGWLRIIGVTGFSWYLLHFPVLNAVNAVFRGTVLDVQPLKWAASFVTCAFVATTTYLLIEKPFMMMSRNLLKRRSTTAVPVTA